MKMKFLIPTGNHLVFNDHALAQMHAHRQLSHWRSEAGGVLLGRLLIESTDVVVDEVTTPQRSDRRARFSFFRSAKHSALALARWTESNSTLGYLGLWHTHPERDPSPSSVDLSDWDKALMQDTFEGDRLFFSIVGIDRIRVWTKSRGGELMMLDEVAETNV